MLYGVGGLMVENGEGKITIARFMRKPEEYVFSLLAGGLFVYSTVISILTPTYIWFTSGQVFLIGLICLLILMLVFFNRYTLIGASLIIVFTALYIWRTRLNPSGVYNTTLYLIQMARGYIPFDPYYDRLLITLISFGMALVAAVFIYIKFRFYVLLFIGSTTFIVNQIMGYAKNEGAFLLFLLCVLLLLVKKSTLRSSAALVAIPVCALAMLVSVRLPVINIESALSAMEIFIRPINAINDYVYLAFNPKYFSFQTTGFTNSNFLSGGPIRPDNRRVMNVESPVRTYLSGATKNYYDGRAWVDTIGTDGPIVGGRTAGDMDFLETYAALIRVEGIDFPLWVSNAPFAFHSIGLFEESSSIPLMYNEPILSGAARLGRLSYYNASMPELNEIIIDIGSNRLATIFTPIKYNGYEFHNFNIQGDVIVSSLGDLSLPNLLRDGARYSFGFMDTMAETPYSDFMLNNAGRGYYRLMKEWADGYNLSPDDLSINPLTLDTSIGNEVNYTSIQSVEYMGETIYYLFADNTEIVRTHDDGPSYFHFTYENDDALRGEFFKYHAAGISIEELIMYSDHVYANYLGLPESLPDRVYDFAMGLTEGLNSNYEKVRAIENYLITIPYTLTPPPIPDGACFVDYFLFEAPEGYCIYYASAMAVLLRCVGIPSRYREGYFLPPSEEADGLHIVTNRSAHAWAEAYMEGYGWLTVEATAPYNRANAELSYYSMSSLFTPDFLEDADYQDHLSLFMPYEELDYSLPWEWLDPIGGASRLDIGQTENTRRLIGNLPNILAYLIFLVIIFTALVWMTITEQGIYERLYLGMVRKLPVNSQAGVFYGGLMRIAFKHFYPYKIGETPLKYAERLKKRLKFKDGSITINELAILHYRAKYEGLNISGGELNLLEDSYRHMTRLLWDITYMPKYIWFRYVQRTSAL